MRRKSCNLFVIGSVMSLLLVVTLSAAGASVGDVDSVDTEFVDSEAALKCDACVLVAAKFGDGFLSGESSLRSAQLSDRQVTEAAEGVCDGNWHGYDTVVEAGLTRLAGPSTGRDVVDGKGSESENLWTHRLQDLCDELLAEVASERLLYDTWSRDHDALEKLLCNGEGSFSTCASPNWGPWPGDEDYDDDYNDDDVEYTHDEF